MYIIKKVIFLSLLFPLLILAHGTLVHQHMVRQAYQLLKSQLGTDIYPVLAHLGNNEEGSGQFNPGNLIVIGAYQEDYSDATNEGAGING